MNIGRNVDSAGGQWYFNGEISDVSIYDRAFCDKELEYLFGIISITPTTGLQATLDYCDAFDGSNGVAVANEAAFNPGSDDFSLSFWLNPAATNTQIVISKNNTASAVKGYTFFIEAGSLIFRVNADGTSTQRASVKVPFTTTDSWHHVVGIIDRTTNKVRLYLDGSETGATPGGGGPTSDDITGFGAFNDTSPINIAQKADGTTQFSGHVLDIRFYNSVLSSPEINEIGQNPKVEWTGTTVFNGTSTFEDLSSSVAKIDDLEEGTIYARFKQASAAGAQSIFAASDSNDGSHELRLHLEGGTILYGVRGDTGNITAQIAVDVADGEWHEAVVTADGTETKIYIDGTLATIQAGSAFFSSVNTINSMSVGRNVDSGGGQWYFNGEISQVSIYDRAFCDQELEDLFGLTPAGPSVEGVVFENGKDGYTCYRIPAIIKAPNGDLLAFSEGRIGGCGDFAQNDIVMKRSTDQGATWGNLEVVCDNVAHNRAVVTNPAPVVDMTDPSNPNGVVRLVYNASNNSEGSVVSGTGVREVFTRISTDNGATWSTPENITVQVHRPNEVSVNPAYNFSEDWRHNAITPGHAIQLKHGTKNGRLLFPANHTIDASGVTEGHSYAFYTDDHGATWHIGGIVEEGTNEVQAVEKTNGEILMTMRKQFHGPGGSTLGTSKYRAGVISSDEGETFGAAFNDFELPDPVVQGSIVRFSTTADSDQNRILIANPAHQSSRVNMTVRISYDEGDTWAISKVINAGASSYSDMAIDNDFNINLLYEHGNDGGIYLAHFDLEWLSDGADSHVLGVKDESLNSEIKVYPVPAKDYINIKLFKTNGLVDVEIYSITGAFLNHFKLENGTHKLDVSGFSQGVYLLKAKYQDKVETTKFIKK